MTLQPVILLPFCDSDESIAPAPSLHVDEAYIPRSEFDRFSNDGLDINLSLWKAYCLAWNKCLTRIRVSRRLCPEIELNLLPVHSTHLAWSLHK